jgi:hypothetical protein
MTIRNETIHNEIIRDDHRNTFRPQERATAPAVERQTTTTTARSRQTALLPRTNRYS